MYTPHYLADRPFHKFLGHQNQEFIDFYLVQERRIFIL